MDLPRLHRREDLLAEPGRHHVADVPSPAGLEYSDGTLCASTDVFGNGSIVTISP